MPSCLAIWSPIATSSPVTILTLRPSFSVSRDGGLGVRPRRVLHRDEPDELPGLAVVGLRDTERANSPATQDRRPSWCSARASRHRPWPARRSPAARPWRIGGSHPCASVTVATVRLLTGSNGTKVVCFKPARADLSFSARSTARSIGSSLLVCVASAAPISTSSGLALPNGIVASTRELVQGQRAGLVAAQHIDAGQFLDRRKPRQDRLLLRQRIGADRHRHRHHRRQCHRNRRHQQDQHELRDRADRRLRSQDGATTMWR